jgi:hypothetical protein
LNHYFQIRSGDSILELRGLLQNENMAEYFEQQSKNLSLYYFFLEVSLVDLLKEIKEEAETSSL